MQFDREKAKQVGLKLARLQRERQQQKKNNPSSPATPAKTLPANKKP